MERKLLKGDNIELLKTLEDNSVDSVVTDPPYGLSFMNKKWDYDVPSVDFWKEVYRVLKPGGHILSFGGTRTYHRMVVNIEDAGFEIRDQIMWVYGSGFPKSHNIGKAVDKLQGNDREVVGWQKYHRNHNDSALDGYKRPIDIERQNGFEQTKGQSPYEGWGTALKPANEPICVARKPLSEKSVAENVLKWGTGGINIDGCRIGTDDKLTRPNVNGYKDNSIYSNKQINGGDKNGIFDDYGSIEGRFPANFIIECICDKVIPGDKGEVIINEGGYEDTSNIYGKYKNIRTTSYTDKNDIHTNPNCPCRLLDEQSGESKSVKRKKVSNTITKPNIDFGGGIKNIDNEYEDTGGASRFFYVPKVSKKERNMGTDKNNHPTVKPINLLTYLVRLVTPPNGIIMDCYMGSGSTGIAAQLEGFNFIGMEMDEEYFNIAESRINNYNEYKQFIK
jgi:DNA modification methylase